MPKEINPLSFVFYKPHHLTWFKNPVRNILRKNRLPNKYEGLFDFMVNSECKVYLSGKLLYAPGIRGIFEYVLDAFELFLWCILNRISFRRVRLILRKKELKGKDVFFSMFYENYTHESVKLSVKGSDLARYLSDIECYKVVHLTHYFYNPTIGSNNLEKFEPDLLIAENNLLLNSLYYKKYFSKLIKKFYQLPFVPGSRFINKIPYDERINKIFATGTITYKMHDREFIDFYGGDELQPLRRDIYEHANKYPDELECFISDLNATRVEKSTPNIFYKIYKRLFYQHPQSGYYKINIVDLFNKYKMFVVPEEICNLPGIAFIEGMACGCVYFGLDDPMYRDIGMIPGIHYIAYDGTEEGLMARVEYFQRRPQELRAISDCGSAFATNKIKSTNVYGAFLAYLEEQKRIPS